MGIYRATIQGTYLGQNINNVVHVASPVFQQSETVTQAQDIAGRVHDAFNRTLKTLLSSEYVLRQVDVVGVNNPTIGAFFAQNQPGGQSGDPLPSYVTVKIAWLTGFRGRASRGRTGLAGLCEPFTDGNTINAATLAAFQAQTNAFRAAVNGGPNNYVMAVVSTVFNGAPRPAPVVTPIVDNVVSPLVGTQLSRKQ